MTTEWALIIALATGLLCGWLARWQWDTRRNWEPPDSDLKRWDIWSKDLP